MEILFVWKGGLASHGALIGAIIAIYLFCRKRNIQFYDLADVLAIPAALGASFIRLGNFINGELVGRITSVPWAVHFEGYEGLRHPSQLYEAGKNLALFFILLNLRKVRHLPKGVIFWGFVGLYSVFRFLVEFYKDFPLHYGLTIGQIISMPFIALAAIMLFYIWKKHEPS